MFGEREAHRFQSVEGHRRQLDEERKRFPIIQGDGFKRSGNGVSGAHNMDYFLEHSDKFEDITVVRTSDNAPGIEEVTYKWETASGRPKWNRKTVYNPNVISDQQFAENVQTALEKAVAQGLNNGNNTVLVGKVTYNVRVDNKRVNSVFPVLPD